LELTFEDSLRLNVLLASARAIRIDEHAMVVHGLLDSGEATIALHPDCRPEQYLRRVREALATVALGSPQGYPVFLQRWTRMGEIRPAALDRLLLLGEPEAVVAVACAPNLTPDLARLAWWAAPTAEVARCMLGCAEVRGSGLGPRLADHLIEHLPFETEPRLMLDTVRLLLQPGLVDTAAHRRIWQAGAHRPAYRVGFLQSAPGALPDPLPAHPALHSYRKRLLGPAERGNALAGLLARALDGAGQTYLAASRELLRRAGAQELATELLNALGAYFGEARHLEGAHTDVARLLAQVEAAPGAGLAELRRTVPELAAEAHAVAVLAHVSGALADKILAHTDAQGSLLRRKLEPVTAPLLAQIEVLCGGA
jgi:hypothetical protein